MTYDHLGRPICLSCSRLITCLHRSEVGGTYIFTCKLCGDQEVVSLRDAAERRRPGSEPVRRRVA